MTSHTRGPKLFSCRGLGFLSMSIPPVLSKATGTCSVYVAECVGNKQKILFYMVLVLIAVGFIFIFLELKPYGAK